MNKVARSPLQERLQKALEQDASLRSRDEPLRIYVPAKLSWTPFVHLDTRLYWGVFGHQQNVDDSSDEQHNRPNLRKSEPHCNDFGDDYYQGMGGEGGFTNSVIFQTKIHFFEKVLIHNVCPVFRSDLNLFFRKI